jgi:hypothetical protein
MSFVFKPLVLREQRAEHVDVDDDHGYLSDEELFIGTACRVTLVTVEDDQDVSEFYRYLFTHYQIQPV